MEENDRKKHHSKHPRAAGHRPHQHKKPKKSLNGYIIGGLIAVVIIALLVRSFYKPAVSVDNPAKYGSANVTFYVMSQCPYGTQVENVFAPVFDELRDNINFRLEFIASGAPGAFNSLHGPAEVEGDKIQLCVQEQYPKGLIDFVTCQNKDPSDLKGSVERCAKKSGMDAQKILECADGEEGDQLLAESIAKSQAVRASGSPTMYFGDSLYSGARDANSFKKEVCKSLNGHPACKDLPTCMSDADCKDQPGKIGICNSPGTTESECTYQDDAAVELKVVNSKDCANCDTANNIKILKQIFLNLDVEEVEASSTRGQAFIKNLGLQKAPSYVFSGSLDQTYAWKANEQLRGAFRKVDKYYVMLDEASGATFILDADKRKALEELTGVTKGDNRPQIDFYVMSYCPYGNIAEEAIEPVFQLLKGKADFNPHYVIYSNYGGGGPDYCIDDAARFCSMHGVQEVSEDVRELCVHKYMGESSFFAFVLEMNDKCSARNADSCWEPVAKSLGLDIEKIKDCEANEWEDLLSNEVALNQALGVRGSPTVFVEGNPYSGSRTPAGYAQVLCEGFDSKPDECSPAKLATLGSASPTPAADAGGCG